MAERQAGLGAPPWLQPLPGQHLVSAHPMLARLGQAGALLRRALLHLVRPALTALLQCGGLAAAVAAALLPLQRGGLAAAVAAALPPPLPLRQMPRRGSQMGRLSAAGAALLGPLPLAAWREAEKGPAGCEAAGPF